MGYSFAAGTTDGPGAFDFTQGTLTDNPLWNTVRNFLAHPTPEDIQCQAPKPILLATGRVTFPYSWQPKVVPTQLLQIGDVVIVALPGDLTVQCPHYTKDCRRFWVFNWRFFLFATVRRWIHNNVRSTCTKCRSRRCLASRRLRWGACHSGWSVQYLHELRHNTRRVCNAAIRSRINDFRSAHTHPLSEPIREADASDGQKWNCRTRPKSPVIGR